MTKAILWGALILVPAVTYAQGQPPIQSAQDAACRQEATRGVLSDSRGLDHYAVARHSSVRYEMGWDVVLPHEPLDDPKGFGRPQLSAQAGFSGGKLLHHPGIPVKTGGSA